MASITTISVDAMYALKSVLAKAVKSLELYSTVENPSRVTYVDADLVLAAAQLSPLAGTGSTTSAVVANGGTLPVQNSAGTVADAAAVATVAGGAVTAVKLASTKAVVSSTVKVTMPVATGTYVNGYTFTVVNGVITAAVAS